ncbi:MAG: hypothetical protein VCE75_12815 [Alphaproteobacteria bacterium]
MAFNVDPFAGLGRRIELVSTDRYFRDVSIALYVQDDGQDGSQFLVRSFANYDGIKGRIAYILDAMITLGGMARAAADTVRFPCGAAHLVAVRRLFLQACKEKPEAAARKSPLSMWDKKTELTIDANGLGGGAYTLSATGESDRRLMALRNALVKLADARLDKDDGTRLTFDCGHEHDAMVGLLLQSAPNVRAVMREFEMNAAKGVLLAPGSQK